METAIWKEFGRTPDDVDARTWRRMALALRLERHYANAGKAE